jgi:cytoskeletal protein RodZ
LLIGKWHDQQSAIPIPHYLMTDIGSQLRAAREAQGLTLEQAFKATRIKQSFLEAIEANQFQSLPGMVQARGFVRSYANFLGLDGEHLASLLDADKTVKTDIRPMPAAPKPIVTPPPTAPKSVVQAPPKPAVVVAPKPAVAQPEKAAQTGGSRPPLKLPSLALNSSKPASSARPSGGIPTWALIAGAAVLFLLGLILVISALSATSETPAPADESNNVPNTIGLPTIDRTELTSASDGPVSITLKSGEHVWARITIDGLTAFEGMLDPNTVKDWQAAEQIIVETGNAAALTVVHQGQENVLGERGQIVARAWGRNGAVDVPLAVPEVTPTVTAAPPNTVQ